jgi:orotate phosphoribosyltransferase
MTIAEQLASIALDIRAIKLSPKDPFTWASGYRMPIYNDNRLLLGNADHRRLIADGFAEIVAKDRMAVDVVGGTVTAGIAFAATLADKLNKPMIYVRDKAKGHGLKNRIEGILKPGQHVLMIEDLVSLGGSVLAAVEGVKEAEGQCNTVLSVFSYEIKESQEMFKAADCRLVPLLTFGTLLKVAISKGFVSKDEEELIDSWRSDPLAWGEKNGFPKVEK